MFIDVATTGLISLDGPTADDVARALVGGLIAHSGPQDLQIRVAATTLERLLPVLPSVPGLLAQEAASLLSDIEGELIRRPRLFDAGGASELGDYRRSTPEEPLPAVMLVLDQESDADPAQMAAIARLGARLGIGTIWIGEHSDSSTRIHVDEEGLATPASSAAAGKARLYKLSPSDAQEVVTALAPARQEDVTPAPAEEGRRGRRAWVCCAGSRSPW